MQELLEKLSDLEHEQWMKWSKTIIEQTMKTDGQTNDNAIIGERIWEKKSRWEKVWIPYSELDEPTKEHDRKWARKVIEIVLGEDRYLQDHYSEMPISKMSKKEAQGYNQGWNAAFEHIRKSLSLWKEGGINDYNKRLIE